MSIKTLFAATAVALAATPALAGEDFAPFTFDGFIDGGVALGGPLPGAYKLGDVDIGVGFAGGFGLNLGITASANYDGIALNGEYAFYPSLSYQTGTSEFSVGVPRSVLDRGYLPGEGIFGSAATIGRTFGFASGSIIQEAYSTNFGAPITFVPVGARWDGQLGMTQLGASAHYLVGNGAVALAAAARHEMDGFDSFDNVALFGGAELLVTGGPPVYALRAGAEAGFERGRVGLLYGHSNTLVDHTIIGYGNYDITNDISVDASLSYFSAGGGFGLATVGAEYRFMDNAYTNASFGVPIGGGPGSPTAELSIGLRF